MNKELIKKYKAEFEHWINEGNVQAFYKNDDEPKWWSDKESTNYDGDDNFSHIIENSLGLDDVLIVIDDECIEFRKALAEGKTVQYNFGNYGINRKDFPNTWKDLDPTIGILRACPENYRIKPEEPKFKVGDWVRDKTSKQHTIKKVTSVYSDSVTVVDSTIGINVMLIKDLELWQPKEGEWCWFWENSDKRPLLGKLTGITESGKFFSGWGTYDYCEPFIGQLPTNLKEPK